MMIQGHLHPNSFLRVFEHREHRRFLRTNISESTESSAIPRIRWANQTSGLRRKLLHSSAHDDRESSCLPPRHAPSHRPLKWVPEPHLAWAFCNKGLFRFVSTPSTRRDFVNLFHTPVSSGGALMVTLWAQVAQMTSACSEGSFQVNGPPEAQPYRWLSMFVSTLCFWDWLVNTWPSGKAQRHPSRETRFWFAARSQDLWEDPAADRGPLF